MSDDYEAEQCPDCGRYWKGLHEETGLCGDCHAVYLEMVDGAEADDEGGLVCCRCGCEYEEAFNGVEDDEGFICEGCLGTYSD